jgi:predicted DsbA family dithiol-disulfide isomerase
MSVAPSSKPNSETLQIDVISDVVCPWCYIGKRRLEKALALKPEISVEVRFRPYFLNPWVPREGMSRNEYLTTKFGSVERYKAVAGRVSAAAVAEGLTYAVEKMKRQPNTLDAHRLILWAGEEGHPEGNSARMKQRLMDLYFSEGGDLSDVNVLVQAAADCGLDPDLVRKRLASEQDVERIEREANAAKDAGIDGVPTFVFGGLAAVSGAQAPEQLAEAIEQVANNREQLVARQAVGRR